MRDYAVDRIVTSDFLLEQGVLLFDPGLVENPLYGEYHFIVIEGLGNIVHRTLFHCFHGRLHGRIAGHDEDRGRGRTRD